MNNSDLVSIFSKIRPSATFMQLHQYKNTVGEIADYNIVFHISYNSALERSIMVLEKYHPNDDFELKAKSELIDGYQNSLSQANSLLEGDKHYQYFHDNTGSLIKGLKLHTKTNSLHLYGAVVNKKIITPVSYPKTSSSPTTKAKEKLRKLTPISAFRQFKIGAGSVQKICVEKMVITP